MSVRDDPVGPEPMLQPQPAPKGLALVVMGGAGLVVAGLLAFATVGVASGPAFDVTRQPLGPGLITPLDDLDPRARASAIASLHLPPPLEQTLVQALDEDRARLAVMAFWDDSAEDGDVVTITAAGVTQTIPIRHGLTPVLTPYIPGGVVRITGVEDGGDIVTVAMMTSGGPVPVKRLMLGETVEVAAP